MGGDGLAGEAEDLDGADDAALVGGVELRRPLRVEAAQRLQHFFPAEGVVFGAQPFPQPVVPLRAFGEIPSGEQRVDIEPGAAHEDRGLSLPQQPVADRARLLHVAGDGVVLRGRANVEHMVGHPGALFGRGLGGADVHAPVDLHGVGRDDLAAESLRELDAEAGFACGRRAADNDNFRLHHS